MWCAFCNNLNFKKRSCHLGRQKQTPSWDTREHMFLAIVFLPATPGYYNFYHCVSGCGCFLWIYLQCWGHSIYKHGPFYSLSHQEGGCRLWAPSELTSSRVHPVTHARGQAGFAFCHWPHVWHCQPHSHCFQSGLCVGQRFESLQFLFRSSISLFISPSVFFLFFASFRGILFFSHEVHFPRILP